MVEININGAQPQQATSRQSQMRNAQQSYKQFTANHADYAKAEAQRRAQWQQENRAYSQRDAQDAAAQAANNRATAAEIRNYESHRSAAQQRQSRRDAELDRLLHARQQFESRASAPLRPSTFHSRMREVDRLQFRNAQYAKKHGGAPYSAADFLSMRTGLGTEGNAFRTAEILRLGNVGQRAAYEGSYRELHHIERELRKIESILEKTRKFASSPADQANLERQKQSLYVARERIAAGWRGTSTTRRSVGMAFGAVMDFAENPVVMATAGAAMAAATAPYDSALAYQKWIGLQRPGLDYTLATNAIGRAGGYNGRDLRRLFVRPVSLGSAYGHTFSPGDWLTGEAARWGLRPNESLQTLGAFGIAQRGARNGMDVLESVRLASLAPGMGLSDNSLAQMLGTATHLGVASNDSLGRQQYFRDLLKTMTLATSLGMDRSRVAQNWGSFLQASASRGLGSDLSGLSSFYRNLLASGLPSARTGQLQTSILAGVSQSLNGLGVGPNPNLPLDISLMSALGGKLPTSAAGLQRAFPGIKLGQSPAQTQALNRYLAAVKAHDPFALNLLGPLLQGQSPDVVRKAIDRSPLFKNMPIGMRESVESQVLGINLMQLEGWQSAPAGTLGDATSGSTAQMPSVGVFGSILKSAQKYNVPLSVAMAVFSRESRFKSRAANGTHIGLGQVSPDVVTAFNQANGTSYSMNDMLRSGPNADVSMWYLSTRPGNTWGAKYSEHYDPESGALADFRMRRASYGGMGQTLQAYGKEGAAEAAGIAASKMVAGVSDTVVAVFKRVGDAGERLAHTFDHLNSSVSAAQHLGVIREPAVAPGPWSLPSHDGSRSPTKR